MQYCHIAILQYCDIAILPYCKSTILQYCNIAILHYCNLATLQYFNIAIFQDCNITRLQYFLNGSILFMFKTYFCKELGPGTITIGFSTKNAAQIRSHIIFWLTFWSIPETFFLLFLISVVFA